MTGSKYFKIAFCFIDPFDLIPSGLVVLFASGTQIFWTIRELFHYDDSDVNIDHVAVYIWYIGAIVGAILGSYLVQRILKRTIYVSMHAFSLDTRSYNGCTTQ